MKPSTYPVSINSPIAMFDGKVVQTGFSSTPWIIEKKPAQIKNMDVNVLWKRVDKEADVTLPKVESLILSPNPHP